MAQNHILLETVELTQSGVSSVVLNNIPQTGYTDLKVVVCARSTRTGTDNSDEIRLVFNSITTGYSTRMIEGNGATYRAVGDSGAYFGRGVIPTDNATASIFGVTEYYIPNYTEAIHKSISINTVAENNATEGMSLLVAGLLANTAAITSMTFTAVGTYDAGSTFSIYGVAATGTTPVTAPFATGGNIVANDGTYWYHAFLSSGTFTPFMDLTCNALIVGGGGGGAEGGGGAGGYRLISGITATKNVSNSIVIGAGGTGGLWGALPYATNGGNSSAFTYTSAGGGYGGLVNGQAGGNGGSGGGAGQVGPSATAGGTGNTPSTSPAQGTNGGSASSGANQYGGGGGGATTGGGGSGTSAGGAGGTGSSTASAYGLATTTGQNISGTVWYAGGGGGGGNGSVGAAGAGGGGVGGSGTTNNGTASTGGGGGGAFGVTGGVGGSGIVIVRYPMV
jgi:hypothetical protein